METPSEAWGRGFESPIAHANQFWHLRPLFLICNGYFSEMSVDFSFTEFEFLPIDSKAFP